MRLRGAADDGKINDEGMALRKAEEAGEFSLPSACVVGAPPPCYAFRLFCCDA